MRTTSPSAGAHVAIDPAILYFGTPVVLLSTVSEQGAHNVAPMSSAFWFGHTALLAMAGRSQTSLNLRSTGECVMNLPSADQVDAVDRLALTTGRPDVSERKQSVGYRYVPDKFGHAGLTPLPADTVEAQRIAECPVNMEAVVSAVRPLGDLDPDTGPAPAWVFEAEVKRVHIHPSIRATEHPDRIDPDAWRPLIMSFQRFYGLGEELRPSRLATIDEEWYR